jgi:DNA end-binding protein Ku
MPRALWKGVLRLGALKVPVRLYSAVVDRDVHFRLLHARDQAPVKQKLVNPKTGEEMSHKAVGKGYEVERGVFVVFTKEELDALEPTDSRDMEVRRFVKPGAIGHAWYERPYYLGPDAGAEADYFALAAALADGGREGIVRWVMRDREHVGALRASRGHPVLIALRHAEEVIPRAELEPPPGRPPSAKELQLAEQLVSTLEEPFDPTRYRDEFRDRVLAYIEAKAKGRKVKLARPKAPAEPASLADALRASLARTGKERKRA